jgi:hypothetical protein
MRLPSLNRWHIIVATMAISAWTLTGCSKNSGPGNGNKNDSDTVRRRITYDSAKFYVTFDLEIQKTSGVYNDTFSDHSSMIVYVVNGVVKVPHDSLRNFPPIVFPQSGQSGSWSATWVPDNIGEMNITDASGLAIPGDTTVVMTLTQTGCIVPKWNVCFLGSCSVSGGDKSPGWPLAFSFNPKLQSQDPFKLDQQGSSWHIWVYKDY